jgi:hypothetical protein
MIRRRILPPRNAVSLAATLPDPGEWHPRMPERLDEKELVDWRAGCDAVVASRFTEISFLVLLIPLALGRSHRMLIMTLWERRG